MGSGFRRKGLRGKRTIPISQNRFHSQNQKPAPPNPVPNSKPKTKPHSEFQNPKPFRLSKPKPIPDDSCPLSSAFCLLSSVPCHPPTAMTTPAKTLKLVKDRKIAFVDFRFTDTIGKFHHITVPASQVDAEFLAEGQKLRRLVHRRLARHQRFGHDFAAGLVHRGGGPVHGRADAGADLHRGDSQRGRIQPLPAQHRGEGGGAFEKKPAWATRRCSGRSRSFLSLTRSFRKPTRTG